MMSSVTVTRRLLCVNMSTRYVYVFMRNACTLTHHNLVCLAYNLHRDRVHLVEYNTRIVRPRRDYNHY